MSFNPTPAQQTILDTLADDNGTSVFASKGGTLASLKALAKAGLVTFEKTDDGLTVTLVDPEAEPAIKAGRPVWDAAEPRLNKEGEPCARDDAGKLTEVPWNFPKGRYPMQKGEFANTALWHEWKAAEVSRRIDALTEQRDGHLEDARRVREGDSPEEKLRKLRERQERAAKKAADEEAALLKEIEDAKNG
jgi:hypothetical protein